MASAPYYLRTLGAFSLHEGGPDGPVVLGASKSLAVVGYLALTPGREAGREHVASLLWPGREGGRRLRGLRQALYYLSRQTRGALVESEGGRLRLVEHRLEADVWGLEAALEAGEVEEALALYRGTLLAGFRGKAGREFEGWVESQGDGLWTGLRTATHRALEEAYGAGRWKRAARIARRYVEIDPMDERVQRTLVGSLARDGREEAAYRQYESYRSLLREELGEEPGEELREAVESLREELLLPREPDGPAAGSRADAGGKLRALAWGFAGALLALAVAGGAIAAGLVTAPWAGGPWEGATGSFHVLRAREDGFARAAVRVEAGEASLETVEGMGPSDVPSPGGRLLAKTVPTPGGPDLRVVGRDGAVVADFATPADDKPRAWSPDGRRLLYRRGWVPEDGRGYATRLHLAVPETGESRALELPDPVPDGTPHRPGREDWSPTGLHIAYEADLGQGSDLVVTDADGGDPRRVTEHPATDTDPAWSPDGRWLAFASDRAGSFSLYLARPDGSELERVTFGPADARHPFWLTREHLVFTEGDDRTGGALTLLEVSTNRTKRLLEGVRVRRILGGADREAAASSEVREVAVVAARREVFPGQRLDLEAVGITAGGDTVAGGRLGLRWTSLDPGVLRVERASGRAEVLAEGEARLAVSAAGWRSDTTMFRSRPLATRSVPLLLWEDWSAGIDSARWVTLGSPQPYVTDVEGGGRERTPPRAFVNHGDENYASGVVSRESLVTGDGITLEFRARLPYSRPIHQSLQLRLYRTDAAPPPERWRQGEPDRRPSPLVRLGFSSRRERPQLRVPGRVVDLHAPGRPDAWHRYALQVEPDGVVAWVVDGVLRWRSSRPLLEELPGAAHLYLGGRSRDTEIQLGPVRAWRGARYGVGPP